MRARRELQPLLAAVAQKQPGRSCITLPPASQLSTIWLLLHSRCPWPAGAADAAPASPYWRLPACCLASLSYVCNSIGQNKANSSTHLGRLLQTIARLAHADVEHQLRHPDLPHGVAGLLVGLCSMQGWVGEGAELRHTNTDAALLLLDDTDARGSLQQPPTRCLGAALGATAIISGAHACCHAGGLVCFFAAIFSARRHSPPSCC